MNHTIVEPSAKSIKSLPNVSEIHNLRALSAYRVVKFIVKVKLMEKRVNRVVGIVMVVKVITQYSTLGTTWKRKYKTRPRRAAMVTGVTAPSTTAECEDSVLYCGERGEALEGALAEEGQGDAQPVCRGVGEGFDECSATENEGNAQLSHPPSEEEALLTAGMLEDESGERQGASLGAAVGVEEPTGEPWAAMAPSGPLYRANARLRRIVESLI